MFAKVIRLKPPGHTVLLGQWVGLMSPSHIVFTLHSSFSPTSVLWYQVKIWVPTVKLFCFPSMNSLMLSEMWILVQRFQHSLIWFFMCVTSGMLCEVWVAWESFRHDLKKTFYMCKYLANMYVCTLHIWRLLKLDLQLWAMVKLGIQWGPLEEKTMLLLAEPAL